MQQEFSFGDWRANRDLNQLRLGERSWKLRPKTMDVLLYMSERPGEVLSIDELISGCWNGVVVSDSSVYQAISELRGVFEDAGSAQLIETIPKRGYRLTVDAPATPAPHPVQRGLRWPAAIAATSLVVIAAVALTQMTGSRDKADAAWLAVLPFADLSPGADREYLADGIAESVFHYLTPVDGLRVKAWPSSYFFKERNEELGVISERLGVRYIVEGSISVDADSVLIRVRLSDAEQGSEIWSDQFEGKLGNVIELEKEIAQAAAAAIGISLGVGELHRLPGMTFTPEAYDHYLRGTWLTVPAMLGSPELVIESIDHLNRAVDLDPDFGLAWLELAIRNSAIEIQVLTGDMAAAAERAHLAMNRAVELMPDSPAVLGFQGLMASTEGRWAETEKLYNAAYESAVGLGVAQVATTYYAEFLLSVGRIEDAIRELEAARVTDPLSPEITADLALAYVSRGDVDAAMSEVKRLESLTSGTPGATRVPSTAFVVMASHDTSLIERALPPRVNGRAGIGVTDVNQIARTHLDAPDEALSLLRQAASNPNPPTIPLATWANYFGDAELALAAFRNAPTEVQVIISWQLWLPYFAGMRQLPGFRDLVRDIGLVDYWRDSGNWSDFCQPLDEFEFECT
jgi:TolB-like protein/DNA-binding winged helix-turn-helix (wHTH) protein